MVTLSTCYIVQSVTFLSIRYGLTLTRNISATLLQEFVERHSRTLIKGLWNEKQY